MQLECKVKHYSQHYQKLIIARMKHPKYSHEEIEIYDIAEWLLQE